jgi:hypothetical protein
MKKCYIAGSITNGNLIPVTEERENAFMQAARVVENGGMYPINPMKLLHNHDKTWLSYMRTCLRAMLTCEVVYMLQGWEQSRGASIEHNLAKELGLKIIYQ